jgi:hypothetical protein
MNLSGCTQNELVRLRWREGTSEDLLAPLGWPRIEEPGAASTFKVQALAGSSWLVDCSVSTPPPGQHHMEGGMASMSAAVLRHGRAPLQLQTHLPYADIKTLPRAASAVSRDEDLLVQLVMTGGFDHDPYRAVLRLCIDQAPPLDVPVALEGELGQLSAPDSSALTIRF